MTRNPQLIRFADRAFQPRFEFGSEAQIAEVSGTHLDTPLGTGFVRFKNADIPWTVRYDEILLVLEGEVAIQTPARTLKAGPNDCIWLPKDTALRYRSDAALAFYAIHPANWAEDIK